MEQPLGKLYAELVVKIDKLQDNIEQATQEFKKLENNVDNTTDKVEQHVTKANKNIKEDIAETSKTVDRDVTDLTKKINDQMAKIGGMLSLGVTAPLTMMGTAALNTFTNFEQAMQNTFSVMGASQSEMEALRKKAEEMGATTRFSASQAADALYSLGSAGQNASQAMNSLDGVLRLAGATGSDLAFTSGTIASTLSQFNLTADKSAHIADVFSQAISKSQANMTKLSYSMKYVGPVASGLNISLETATAALMNLYNTGFGGEQAGTILRAGLQKLASGTDELKEKLKKYGLTYDEINPKLNNLADIMDRLKEANIGVTEANELFGEASSAGMAKLIEQGGEAIRTMDGLLTSSDGAAAKMQEIQNASFANTKAELQSAFEAVQITIMSNVMPAIDTLAKGATSVLNFINELPVGVQTAGTALATLAAAAGPLLLVAVGVKKIKAEMAQLNMVMSANPIFAIGAAVAAVGVVAAGVVAQVKRSYAEAEKAAGKYYERAASLADEAKSTRSKNNSISALLETYETLHNKTVKTTEEQARYNQTLNELKELVPDIVTGQEAIGDAYLQNVEKAKAAQRELLELERQKKEQALAVAQAGRVEAQKTVDKYKPDWDKAKEQLDKANAEMVDSEKQRDQIRRLVDIYETADKERRAEIGKELEQLSAAIGEYAFRADDEYAISVGNSLDTLVNFAEKKLNKTLKKAEKASGKFEKINAKIEDAQNIIANIDTLEREIAAIENMQAANDSADTKKTRQQYADEAMKAYREKAKQIDDEAKKAVEAGNKAYDAIDEKTKEVKSKIDQLIKTSGDAIIDGAFTENSIELKYLYAELNRLQALKEKGKSSGGKKSAEVIDNSYQAQIKKLDESYQTQLQQAKDFGKDMNAIEQAWRDERAKLIDGFIDAEIAKEQKKNKALSDADARRKAEAVKTNKDTSVTLGDEKYKTQFMGPGLTAGIARTKATREQLKKELADVYEQIGAINAMGLNLAVDSAEKQATLAYLDELKKKAESIEIELNPKYKSNADIVNELKGLEGATTSDLKKQWNKINKQKDTYLKDIKDAKERGIGEFEGLSPENADKKEAEFKKKADKFEADSKAAAANGIVQGVLGIADQISGIIAQAIENGGLDGISALKASGGLLTQIGSLIPGVGGIVTGAVGSALGMVGSILGAVRNRSKKITEQARQDAKEFNDEIARVQEENIQRANTLAGEVAKNIANNFARHKINARTIFDTYALDVEKKRIDGFLDKVKDLKTAASFTYQQKRTRKVDKWYDPLDWFHEEETYYTTETAQYTVSQVLEKYNDAIQKGDYELAKKWKDFAQKAIEKGLKDAHISEGNIDPISDYMGNLDNALAQYVKTRDMKAFKEALKQQLYEALVNKTVTSIISKRIGQVFNQIESNNISYEEGMKKIESIGNEAANLFDDMNRRFGLGAVQAQNEWTKVGDAISSSLSSALGNAAYDADWGSFKKAFAGEMKKAIIESALQSAGVKEKVDAIIKGVMADGKITGDEVNDTIGKMKPMFDTLEHDMAEVAKIVEALSGDKTIEMKAKGEIIQQLSGADRDWFTEVFQEGFSKMSLAVQETNIQYLAASQLIINTVHFTSYDGKVYITANENTDLKGLITEVVKEVVA